MTAGWRLALDEDSCPWAARLPIGAMRTIRIPAQFNGPPGSGNGGYAAGCLAAFIDGPAAVELRAPVPLETELRVIETNAGLEVSHDGQLIMRANSAAPALPPPAFPGLDLAARGHETFPTPEQHALPHCFVCGPLRKEGDGLCLFTGRLEETGTALDIWTPLEVFGDGTGHVRPEIVWAALDCPSAFAINDADNLMLLGRITTRIDALPPIGQPVIVVGWQARRDGRKHFAGTALFAEDRSLLAQADTLWIELKPN